MAHSKGLRVYFAMVTQNIEASHPMTPVGMLRRVSSLTLKWRFLTTIE